MAKAKEKMEALVPAEEQPYTVPANWRWCYIRAGYNVTSSKRIHKDDWKTEGIPFYRTRELVKLSEYGYVDNELFISPQLYEKCKREYGVPRINDLLISGVGTIGIPYVVKDETPFYFKDGNVIWLQNKGLFYSQYIFYLYKSHYMQNQVYGMSSGTTVDTYTIINANSTVIPAPPIAEQQRIVDRIESLFSKLDEAKEKAQAVVDGYEDRKAAILHKAFIGDLTEKWRKENKVSNQWRTVCFDEVADIRSNLVDPSEYQGYPHIAPDNIEKKTGRLLEYRTVAEDKVKSGKHLFHSGQILYSKIRPYLSKVIIVDFDGLCSADMYPIDAKENMLLRFLWYYMLSDDFLLQASSAGSRSVLPKINQKELSGLLVRTTIEKEQIEVVRILDTLLQSIQNTKDIAERTIESIDEMKKSILAKAFRGELGTNDPSEEPVDL